MPIGATDARAGTAVTQAYDALLAFVRSAPIGSRLPGERDLSRRLGVSRSTLRSASHRLALLGYLRVKHGSGAVTSRPTASDVAAPFSAALLDVPESIVDAMRLRQIVEPELAALAARADSLEVERVAEKSRTGDDADFHMGVASLAGNAVAVQVVGVLVGLVASTAAGFISGDTRSASVASQQHLALLEAIAHGDQHLAREAMLLHLRWETRLFTASTA